jgi:L-amino acid N-acyltransferase YncA
MAAGGYASQPRTDGDPRIPARPGLIRAVVRGDAAAIAAIYAPNVRDSFISFELEVPGAEEMAARIAATTVSHPWLVYEMDGRVVGYAYASKHRERLAYQWSADVSCYVDAGARGRGIGRALYEALLERLRGQGFRNAYAGIALPNEASVRLHESVGFKPLCVYEGVGYKLGAWRDVGWWQLRLGDLESVPVPPRGFGTPDEHR